MTVALITGSSGFVGSHLRQSLVSSGWTVVGFGRRQLDPRDAEDYVVGDVTVEDEVCAALESVRPDVVFHLAAASPQKEADPAELVRMIVAGTHAVCTALRRVGLRSRLVLAGSSAQYGAPVSRAQRITEATPCRPLTSYGHAKAAAESLALALSLDGTFELVPARPFNHIGPGEPPTTVAGSLAARIASIIEGRADRIQVSNLSTVRDFTDVRDIARGYRALAERGVPSRPYNLCSGRGMSVGQILDGLLRAAGLDATIVDVVPSKENGVARQVGSPVRVRADTGWVAEMAVAASLTDLLEAARRAVRVAEAVGTSPEGSARAT